MTERLSGAPNPALTPSLRLFSAVVVLVLLVGASLFFAPGLVQPRWPWSLTPFNTRFLGAFYTAELVMMGLLLAVNRWAPARVVLPMAFLFTALVTAVSLRALDRFDLQRPIAQAWFVVYLGALLGSAWFLCRYRALPPVEPRPPPLLWRAYLGVQAGGFTLYGLGLLLAPGTFGAFWPWALDGFHAQLYSAVFVAGGVGSFLLVRAAAPVELLTLGLSQAVLGGLAVLGLVLVDAGVNRVDWALPGTWLWLAMFGVPALAGVGIALEAGRRRAAA
jgi:hypothetical protein